MSSGPRSRGDVRAASGGGRPPGEPSAVAGVRQPVAAAPRWYPRLVLVGGAAGALGVAMVVLGALGPATATTADRLASSPLNSSDRLASSPIRVTGGYIPRPASPDVGSAYFTVHDDGDSPDELVGITTPHARSAELHREVTTGTTEQMAPVAGGIAVPAHGSVALAPDGLHAMLIQPSALVVGQSVPVTLLFTRSGPVTVDLPVRGLLDGPAPADSVDPPATASPEPPTGATAGGGG